MRYDTILMDADETILDFHRSEFHAFQNTMEHYGIFWSQELYEHYSQMSQSLWKQFERGEISKQDILNRRFRLTFEQRGISGEFPGLEDYYQETLSAGCFVIEGAREACQTLAKTCRLYIVTNGVAFTQRRRMRDSGMRDLFEELFISEEIGVQKPRKEFFDYVFSHIPEKDKTRILLVGDSITSDIAGGVNAGIDTCLYNRYGDFSAGTGGAVYCISDLRELYAIIGGENHG